jgi:hypothetical protein
LTEEAIIGKYKELSGMSDTNLKAHFIQVSRGIIRRMMKAYKLVVFFVIEEKPVLLGLSRDSLLLMEISKLEVIRQYTFSEITEWRVVEDAHVTALSIVANGGAHELTTPEAEAISSILNQYKANQLH